MTSLRQLAQCFSLLRVNIRSLRRRVGSASIVIISTAGLVAVLVGMLAMGDGLRALVSTHIGHERVVIRSADAVNLQQSNLTREDLRAIERTPGIRKLPGDELAVDASFYVMARGVRQGGDKATSFPLVGVGPHYQAMHSEFRVVNGRMFAPGVREVVVGVDRAVGVKGLALGQTLTVDDIDWQVVGQFSVDDASAVQGAVLADTQAMMDAYGRRSYQQVTVLLESSTGLDSFSEALQSRVRARAAPEHEVLAEDIRSFSHALHFTAYLVGSVFATGIAMGVMSAMYAIVDSRRYESVVFRALGFTRFAVFGSLMLEALLFALVGGLVGAAAAWASLDGDLMDSMGSMFRLSVTADSAVTGLFWSFAVCFLCAVGPAARAARPSLVSGTVV